MLEARLIAAKEAGSRRLLIVLHGLGDSLRGYLGFPGELNLPWLNCLLANAPNPYYTGYSWFDFPGDPRPGVAASYGLLSELLDHQRAQGIPPEEIALLGFSQGCLMVWETGLRYPHRLAGCVGISGFICEPETLLRERSPVSGSQKFLVTHGYMDPVIPFAESKKQVEFMKKSGVDVQWYECPKAHTIDPYGEMQAIRRFIQQCFVK
jgi:predicted esterase